MRKRKPKILIGRRLRINRRRKRKPVVLQDAMRRVNFRLLPRKNSVWNILSKVLKDECSLYNLGHRYCIESKSETGKFPTKYDLHKMLTIWRKKDLGLAKGSIVIQRGTLNRVVQAFQDYERRKRENDKREKEGKEVKHKNLQLPKRKSFKDFASIVISTGIIIREDNVYIPKLGRIRIRRKGGNPYPQGTPCNATLVKKYGKWYVSIAFAIRVPMPRNNGKILGVDRNVRQVVDSEGNFYRMPDTKKLEAKIAQLERRAARCRKGSNRWRRFHTKIGRLKTHIACIKHNHNHHVSKILARNAGTIILEKLNTKSMMASARGTVENPGKNVKQKAGLNRGIQGSNWYQLQRMIEYKAHSVLYVKPAYTSQTCYACGHVNKGNRKSQAVFECVECGHSTNADINAALNIRRLGLTHLHGEKRSRERL